MTCEKCGRRVKNSLESKMVHIAKHHPDILLVRAVQSLFNPQISEAAGMALGDAFKRELNKRRYGSIGKIH
jgi:hypothetical protein